MKRYRFNFINTLKFLICLPWLAVCVTADAIRWLVNLVPAEVWYILAGLCLLDMLSDD